MRNYRYVFLSFFIGGLSQTSLLASHVTGGELTWLCNCNNKYIFQMKFYRDCNGIPQSVTLALNTTVPGVATINLALFSQTDISPDGLQVDGTSPCLTCLMGSSGYPVFGLIEEFVYESAPVLLN